MSPNSINASYYIYKKMSSAYNSIKNDSIVQTKKSYKVTTLALFLQTLKRNAKEKESLICSTVLQEEKNKEKTLIRQQITHFNEYKVYKGLYGIVLALKSFIF